MGLNWLITGGCGFIGRNLIAKLLDEGGHNIRVVDNLSVGSAGDLGAIGDYQLLGPAGSVFQAPDGLELVVADIKDTSSANLVCNGVDVVVHLAANTGVGPSVENPMADCKTNVIGTLNYLEACRLNSVGRFVFASSGAPAGEVEPPIHEEIVPKPVSPYGASKLSGEGYCSSYFRCFGIETIALRFGNVYGPRSLHKSSVVAKFLDTALRGEPLNIYGDGSQTRDFIFVADLLDAIKKASEVPGIGGEVYQIASNKETTVSELVEILAEKLVENGLAKPEVIYSEKRQGDVARNYSDTSKARKKLGWTTETTLHEGLDKTIRYFLEGKE